MQKVLVIGSGGAGKSTFAATLGDRLGLPVIHLDAHYWQPGWVEPAKEDWVRTVETLLAWEAWVMDGNYGGTLDRRLDACDTILFLDLPRLVCLGRVVRRRWRFQGRSRPDMAPGCPERLTWDFVRWIWTYPRLRRRGVLRRLEASGKRVVVLRSTSEVRRFLAGLPTSPVATTSRQG